MRQLFLILLFCCSLAASALATEFPETAAVSNPDATVDMAGREDQLAKMLDEHQSFDIAFLWFDRLASGELSLAAADEPGRYRAVLAARTLGLAAWLTRDRLQRYESLMQLREDGRLQTVSHSSTIYKGKGTKRHGRTKTFHFDYAQRQVGISVERNGVVTNGEPLPMAEGEQPQDVLTAFYNFRAGFYGPIRPGRNISIPTFTRKGSSEILIDVLTRSEWPKGLKIPEGEVLARVTLDQEIFKTGGGRVYVWFNAEGIPDGAVVEKVLGMGDVRGTRVTGGKK